MYTYETILTLKKKRPQISDVNNVADFLSTAKLLLPHIYVSFSITFLIHTCVYPESWTKGVIVSLYKKGKDVNQKVTVALHMLILFPKSFC